MGDSESLFTKLMTKKPGNFAEQVRLSALFVFFHPLREPPVYFGGHKQRNASRIIIAHAGSANASI
jgi:hypothetical protein